MLRKAQHKVRKWSDISAFNGHRYHPYCERTPAGPGCKSDLVWKSDKYVSKASDAFTAEEARKWCPCPPAKKWTQSPFAGVGFLASVRGL